MTIQQEKAALLVARGGKSLPKIAKQVEVAERTLDDWVARQDFKARVSALREEYRKQLREEWYADVTERVALYRDLINRFKGIIAARSKDERMQDVPGGKTGMIRVKPGKFGDEFIPDTPLAAELVSLCDAVATDLGQRTTKHEHSGPGGGPIPVEISRLTDDDLARAIELARKIAAPGSGAAPPAEE